MQGPHSCAGHMAPILGIPELFEHVLLQLDLRTLLVSAQRVSRQWRHFIRDSSALQKALFFQIDDSHNQDGRPIRNPLLSTLFPKWFTTIDDRGRNQLPFIYDYEREPFAAIFAAFSCSAASWRNMLVQQRPAARTLGHWHKSASWVGKADIETHLYTYVQHGLRMGHFYRTTTILVNVDGLPNVFWADSPTLAENFTNVDDFAHFDLAASSERTPQPDFLEIAQEKRKLAERADVILASYTFSGWCGTEDDSEERWRVAIKYSFEADEGLEGACVDRWKSETVYSNEDSL